jgi:SAM-dependent methyltransferase
MRDTHRAAAVLVRSRLARGGVTPERFREALASVPPCERDAWVDLVCGVDEIPNDEPELPRGGVPYLPCAVATLLDMVELAEVQSSDVFVDVGAGMGRAIALTHLLTGAACIGLEIQPGLVRAARELATRLNLSRSSMVEGDAAELTGLVTIGTVFFLYCPFSGDRLSRVIGDLEDIARTRQIRVCCVDLPLPPCGWLDPIAPGQELVVYRSAPLSPSRDARSIPSATSGTGSARSA